MIVGAVATIRHRLDQCVVFDLDGTLVDTAPTLEWAINTALDDVGLPTLRRGAARQHIGHGLDHFVHRATHEVTSAAVGERLGAAISERFHALLRADPCHGASPRLGAVELLEQLDAHGVAVGLCTNKSTAMAAAVLRGMDLDHHICVRVGGDTLAERKPSPEPLRRCLQLLGHTSESSLYVGDSAIDVATAQAAGTPVVVVRGGYEQADIDTLGADAVIDELIDLIDLRGTTPGTTHLVPLHHPNRRNMS